MKEQKGRIDISQKVHRELKKKSKDVSVNYMNKLAEEYISHGLKYDKEHGTTCYQQVRVRIIKCRIK